MTFVGLFTSLRTRLTVLYGALFCVVMLLVGASTYVVVATNAQAVVRKELVSGGAVFDRIWSMREKQLVDNATVLSRDFGFRAAVATHDRATTSSALDNLKNRLALDSAFLVGADGDVTGDKLDPAAAQRLWTALDAGASAGVLQIGGQPYQAIARPVLAPELQGWLVFAERIDQAELDGLEKLSAIPLKAAVLSREPRGRWTAVGPAGKDRGRLAAFVDAAPRAGLNKPRALTTETGQAIALAKPLQSFYPDSATMLVLRYPLGAALAPYRPLLVSLIGLGLASLAGLVFGASLLARSITRPISSLDEAAHRLERGEDAAVEVEGRDEIARLAASFNAMASGIHERERRITLMALTDQETGLANRRVVEDAIARAARGAVAVIGIERYAQVRAAIGYQMTAAMIGQIGERLAALGSELAFGRLSSERLGLLIAAEHPDDAEREAERILDALEQPLVVDGVPIDVGFRVGLAEIDRAAAIPVLERASIALDQARKEGGRSRWFDGAAYEDPASKLSLMSEMLGAMRDGSISLHYQPKYDLRAGRVTAAEALARWRHPVRRMVSPDLFVTLAEETGHIRALTYWSLERIIADQAALRAQGHHHRLSLNISGRMLSDEAFIDEAVARIAAAKAELCFEITETAMIAHPGAALEMVARLRRAGVHISLDDYGSGLSSLAYLKQIPADELKIDKAFVLQLDTSGRDALMVKSTVDLGHSLGLEIVAEGVETAEALARLSAMGCDLAQGYFIARPMPLDDFTGFLANTPTFAPKPSGRLRRA